MDAGSEPHTVGKALENLGVKPWREPGAADRGAAPGEARQGADAMPENVKR